MADCTTCGRPHVTRTGTPACTGHISTGRKGEPPKERAGQPCANAPLRGQVKCRMHGGGSPQAKRAAAKRLERAQAEKTLAEALRDAYGDDVPDISPADAMLRAVSWTYAEAAVLRRKVAELGEDERVWGVTREKSGGEDYGTTTEAGPNVWWTMYTEAKRDLVKFSAAARAAGCDEARVRLAEQQGQLVADVIRGIADDLLAAMVAAGLTERFAGVFRTAVAEVVPRRLRAIAS